MNRERAIGRQLYPADEGLLRRVGGIMGPQSAAAKVLAELRMRREAGETAAVWIVNSHYVVGPAPSSEDKG